MTRQGITVGLLLAAVVAGGCGSPAAPPPRTGAEKPAGEPLVRVRIGRGVEELRFTGPARVQVYPADQPERRQMLATPLTVRRNGGVWAAPWTGHTPPGADVLVVEPLGPAMLAIGEARYPGRVRLVPLREDSGRGAGERFDAVNDLRVEAYLPGVLDRELYDHWKPATYLAQAIAARTYAIERIMTAGPARHFDVESTTASQAYIGHSVHPLTQRAVADTAGLVLTHDGRLFASYYSSTCGGVGQSPVDAFGTPYHIPPLEPAAPCDWCGWAKRYQWGTIERDRRELSRRIALWGGRNDHPVANLATLRSIRISERNRLGRPVRYELTDDRGDRFTIHGDMLRTACNASSESGGLGRPRDPVHSGFLEAEVSGETVRFAGRGFGHGVGLCQFGAEGMARDGYEPPDILAQYYPGARIERAY